jgi:endonuclease VIII
MEGPSIFLAAEQLQPFVGRRVTKVSGNSRVGIDRFQGKRLTHIFAWGKHLILQFETFALRVHFLLWGTFAATVNGVSVTGDYRRAGRPRLVLEFANGEITMWSASLRILDSADAREEYDFTADILSESWNRRSALRKVRTHGREEIADVLLDQSIFAGVGNIIKNEVLFRTRTSPFTKVNRLSPTQLRRIADEARVFSFRFLDLRREFALRKHLEIYGRSTCPSCRGKVSRKVHGERGRRTFFCPVCQHTSPRRSNPSRSSPASTVRRRIRRAH